MKNLIFLLLITLDGSSSSPINETFGHRRFLRQVSKCVLELEDLPIINQPLYIRPGTIQIFYPDTSNKIELNAGGQIELFCEKGFKNIPKVNLATLNCVKDKIFSYSGSNFPFNKFECNSWSDAKLLKNPRKCAQTNGDLVQVGFQISPNRFTQIFTVCFDSTNYNNFYSHHETTPTHFQRGFTNTELFQDRGYFPKCKPNVNAQYTKGMQLQTIGKIISKERAEFYLKDVAEKNGGNGFFSRGHTAPKADFTYAVLQRATYLFINVAPQWQSFNGNNWGNIEDATRLLSIRKQKSLQVWTGTLGVLTLKNKSNQWREIFLNYQENQRTKTIENRVKVPFLYFKVVINESGNEGVVLIGENTHTSDMVETSKKVKICPDVQSQISWLTWNADQAGRIYACSVREFLRVNSHLSADIPEPRYLLTR